MIGELHVPAALLQGKQPVTPCTGCCVGPRAGFGILDKEKIS